jgi:50S ribosome-binding GTPase
MTEGQDASGPALWKRVRRMPATPDGGYVGAGRTSASDALPGGSLAPDEVTEGAPGLVVTSVKHGGTGWPGPESARSGVAESGVAESGAAESGAAESNPAQSGAAESGAGAEAGTGQPGARRRSGSKSDEGQPDAASREVRPRGRHSARQPQAADQPRAADQPWAADQPQAAGQSAPARAATPAPAAAPTRTTASPKPESARPASARPGSAGRGTATAGPAQPLRSEAGPTRAPTSGAGAGGIWAARAEPTGQTRPPSSARPARNARAADQDDRDEPFARVDARKLEAALLGLRHPIVTVPLLFEAPGVAEARAERVKLLSQIDDYLLPRLRQSGAPILVALVGSTGAGKSTLMNSLVGKQVSATGIRRPTTNSPVLACHPDDMRWFAENVFLPTLPRVRQQGLAMPGRDGLLVLAASEGMPRGVALLDTPDIDSVVQAHRDFAHQFLDASDLWLFVTTARRYADAAVWEMLQVARDRGAALALALSRVPPSASGELADHFDAMLEANGLRDVRRFIIPETIIAESRLPSEVAAPIRDWLADTARREDRRVAVLTQTMSGVLDTFRSRVPALADQVAEQVESRLGLRDAVDAAYAGSLADFGEATRDGSLVRGEVLARWQDFAGTGDLLRTLQVRRGRGGNKQKKQRMPERANALKLAVRTSMEALIAAAADRAAELVVTQWRQHPAGARLLADIDASSRRGSGNEADFVASALADLGVVSGTAAGGSRQDSAALARSTAGLAPLAERVVASWQEYVVQLVKQENVTKRSIARLVSFDEESLAVVLSIGVLGYAADADADAEADGQQGETAVPERLLASLFGTGLLRDMGARARQDLSDRVNGLLEAETLRYFAIIDAAGVPTDTAAAELLQAGYALEAAR